MGLNLQWCLHFFSFLAFSCLLSSDPLSLSLIFVYWSPNTSSLEVSIYFSHSLSCSCWLSHHFYLYLLPLSFSHLFLFSFFFLFHTQSHTQHPLCQFSLLFCPDPSWVDILSILKPSWNDATPLSYLCAAAAKLLQWCLTLCDPVDGSQPGSPIPRILKARTLEWVAIAFSPTYARLSLL